VLGEDLVAAAELDDPVAGVGLERMPEDVAQQPVAADSTAAFHHIAGQVHASVEQQPEPQRVQQAVTVT
jgi:hypothetical protein